VDAKVPVKEDVQRPVQADVPVVAVRPVVVIVQEVVVPVAAENVRELAKVLAQAVVIPVVREDVTLHVQVVAVVGVHLLAVILVPEIAKEHVQAIVPVVVPIVVLAVLPARQSKLIFKIPWLTAFRAESAKSDSKSMAIRSLILAIILPGITA